MCKNLPFPGRFLHCGDMLRIFKTHLVLHLAHALGYNKSTNFLNNGHTEEAACRQRQLTSSS